MRRFSATFLATAFAVLPLFAGALTLQVDDVKANPEALSKGAIVAAHITACHSPEKTTVEATAAGIVNGKWQAIPLKVIHLSEPGAFAVARQWPAEGIWAVTLIATNPDYKNYATSIVVPIRNDIADSAYAKAFYHAPSSDEVSSVLKKTMVE